MGLSWTKRTKEFKSSLSVVAACLLKSRETKAAKCRRQREEIDEFKRQLEQQRRLLQQQEEKTAELRRYIQQLEMQQHANRAPALPADPPIGSHGYGPRMISLAVNVAKRVGLRAAEDVLKICFEWFGVSHAIPSWTAIRGWLLRLGVAAINEPAEPADDWIWLADHSNQIGQEKVLAVLGVRASQLPEPGTTLKHEHVRVLTVKPGLHWKRGDMSNAYDELAERFGAPRAVLVDGAPELRDGAEILKKRGKNPLVLRDFKHKAANLLESMVGNTERFQEFCRHLGRTRAGIQQTELAHLAPLTPKQKARFMNLAATLNWATMVLWVLEHPQAQSRQGLTPERLEQKLGWLREFADNLAVWNECQLVVSKSVTFINEQALSQGASAALRDELGELIHTTSRNLAERLIGFVKEAEELLQPGERLPMSTEILESSFGLYKQLERQHSRGGFTSLLAAYAALLRPATPASVKEAFRRVSTKDVKQWVADHFGPTLTSKRRAAYVEHSKAIKCATNLAATG